MVKRIGTLIVVTMLLVLATACGKSAAGKYKDGTYKGAAEGLNGPIKVEVLVEKGKIMNIKALEHKETPGVSDGAFKKVPEAIIKAQNTEVDVVGGATKSSKGIMNAVKDALKSAN